MGSIPIKIVIAGRTYPLTIDADEEENIRKAAKNIEASIDEFQKNYAVSDKQDLLAMTALQMATQAIVSEDNAKMETTINALKAIETTIATYLKANEA